MRATRSGQGLVTILSPVPRPFAFTPTVAWPGNTLAGSTGFYLKQPGLLTMWITFQVTVGTVNAALTVALPNGYTAVSQAGALVSGVGVFTQGNTGNTFIGMSAAAGATQIAATVSPWTAVVATYSGMFVIPTLT